MTRNFLTVALLGVVSTAAIVAGGCASDGSNDRPYSLTGNVDRAHASYPDQVSVNRARARGEYVPPRATNGQ